MPDPTRGPEQPRLHHEGTARVWRLPDHREHCTTGPAVVDEAKGLEEWWENGVRHRVGGPAYTSATMRGWWFRGRRHRDDGPACENLTNGVVQWYFHGERHREGAPAITGGGFPDEWWVRGRQHRLDGPAVVSDDGTTRWWFVHGQEVYDTDPLEELLAAGRTRILELSLAGWTPEGPSVRDLIDAVRAAHA